MGDRTALREDVEHEEEERELDGGERLRRLAIISLH